MPTREALTQGYYDIGKAVDAKLPAYFSTMPKTEARDPALRAVPSRSSRPAAAMSRARPTARGPGIFYFNAYDLPSRTTPGMTTLYLHEGAPGHHFQISLAQENEALPPFMRFGGNTAYVEGWALYAETLGYDMGFYKDPYPALRHAVATRCCARCGWWSTPASTPRVGPASRRSNTCSSHSDMGKTDATAEVERYIAIPSQALAYKIGALTIQRLRKQGRGRAWAPSSTSANSTPRC